MQKTKFSIKEALRDLNKPRGELLKLGFKGALTDFQVSALKPLYDDKINTVFIAASRKTGKTQMAIYAAYKHAFENPGSIIYFVGPEKDHLAKIYWVNNRLQRFLGDDSDKYIKSIRDREKTIRLHNNSVILLMGSENWKAGQGHDPDLLIYDEFKAFHPKFHTEMGPNRAAKGAKLLIIGTQPSVGDRNKEEYESMAENAQNSEGAAYFEATIWDNPINLQENNKKIIEEEIQRLRDSGQEDVVQREYFSKIVPGGSRSVFPTFNREKHVISHSLIMERIKAHADQFDFYNIIDPAGRGIFGGIFAAINRKTKHIFILDEIYEKDRILSVVSNMIPHIMGKMVELNPNLKPANWIKLCDEHETLYIAEIYNSYGLVYGTTDKNNNKKEGGLSILRDAFLLDRIYLSDRCINAAKEIEEYAYNEFGEIPKNHRVKDHCFSGDTQIITSKGLKRIDEITIHDKVLTRGGYKEVLKTWDNGEKDTVIATFSDGTSINCTSDHEIYTLNRGFVSVDQLTPQDMCVKRDTATKTVRLKRLEPAGKIKVYDLSVKDNPEYYANGILVHNCTDCMRYMIAAAGYSTAQILDSNNRIPKDWNWVLRGFGEFATERDELESYYKKIKRSDYDTF